MQRGNVSIVVSVIFAVALVGLIIYAIINAKTAAYNPSLAISQNQPADNTNTISTNTTPTIPTKAPAPTPSTKPMDQTAKDGDTLVMNYTGRLTDGTVFDSNVDPKFGHVQPFEFVLGAGTVIKGWDIGLVGMKVGQKKTLTIPPEDGYGSRAVPTQFGSIPANSTLIFEVELLAIK